MNKFIERRQNNRPLDKDIVIIYHGNCSDGFSSAWAAWKKFGDSADYVPVQHHESIPEGLTGKEIYTIDFTYPLEVIKKLIAENKRVTSIDHHVSAKEVIEITQDYSYGTDHSGAVLSWQYFHSDKPVPLLLKYVEDTDLWKFKLPNSKELFAVLDLYDFSFENWDKLASDFEDPEKLSKYIEDGALLLRHEVKKVEELVSNNAELVEFEGYKTYAVNSPNFVSKVGNALALKLPPISIIWSSKADGIAVSLRSDGTADVAEIAKKYGGGGHKAASGFSLKSLDEIPWKKIESN